jgi:hypothetical protein
LITAHAAITAAATCSRETVAPNASRTSRSANFLTAGLARITPVRADATPCSTPKSK